MDKYASFREECRIEISAMGADEELAALTKQWLNRANAHKYSYHFEWLGRPIIQYPQDIVAFQEVVWDVKPDLIIELGIAHGGSLILSASLLAMLDYCDAAAVGGTIDPHNPTRTVLGVDIDVRDHNRAAIEAHGMSSRIAMIQGSSIALEVIEQVKARAEGKQRVLLALDSNHTHDHVLAELEAYAPLVTKGSYACVFDTVIEDLPEDSSPKRSWGKGDNPKTAVWKYLKDHPEFEIDSSIDDKLLVSVAPDGWLKRVG